jgi:hypothetical protein
MIKCTFFLLSILLFLIACRKENTLNGNSQNSIPTLLKKVVVTNYDGSIHTYSYKYDNQNRFITFIGTGNQYSGKSIITVEYGTQNHINKTTYYQTDSNNVITAYHNSCLFEYNNDNKIVKNTYLALSPTTTGGNNHSYKYDSLGRLIADTTLPTVPNNPKRYTTFTYDTSNNVIKRREYYGNNVGTAYSFMYEYTSTYDTNANPYKNIGPVLYVISADRYPISACNLTREFRSGDYPYVMIHTYDSTHRIIKSLSYPEPYPNMWSTTEYYY